MKRYRVMGIRSTRDGLSCSDALLKRAFDLFFSVLGLLATWWLILLAACIATLDTKNSGFFTQLRVGKNGKLFSVIKIRTMRCLEGVDTAVTVAGDMRITPIGKVLRRYKIDELPQLINVLLGQMSFVGPRPDVPGYADRLEGGDRLVLSIRPGITGPATLKYRDEEVILVSQSNPEAYNREVIWPDKVKINLEYIRNWSFSNDIRLICQTVFKR